ncbi:MAG: hypothetical protein IJE68_04820 [Clostridia bacterium]|nr:hypothetical protein [Clostridia bacterium]
MSRGKHSANVKHFDEPTGKKSILKTLFKIVILFIIIILAYFAYDLYLKDLDIFKSSNSQSIVDDDIEIYEPTEKVEIETVLTVKGAEYLEITGVHINSDDPKLSTVAARLKNNSDQAYENVNLRISLFDKDNNEITFLDYKINKIEANGEAATHAAIKKDLSNCVNYSIALKKPD